MSDNVIYRSFRILQDDGTVDWNLLILGCYTQMVILFFVDNGDKFVFGHNLKKKNVAFCLYDVCPG